MVFDIMIKIGFQNIDAAIYPTSTDHYAADATLKQFQLVGAEEAKKEVMEAVRSYPDRPLGNDFAKKFAKTTLTARLSTCRMKHILLKTVNDLLTGDSSLDILCFTEVAQEEARTQFYERRGTLSGLQLDAKQKELSTKNAFNVTLEYVWKAAGAAGEKDVQTMTDTDGKPLNIRESQEGRLGDGPLIKMHKFSNSSANIDFIVFSKTSVTLELPAAEVTRLNTDMPSRYLHLKATNTLTTDRPVNLIICHLARRDKRRKAELMELLKLMTDCRNADEPCVTIGDFNTVEKMVENAFSSLIDKSYRPFFHCIGVKEEPTFASSHRSVYKTRSIVQRRQNAGGANVARAWASTNARRRGQSAAASRRRGTQGTRRRGQSAAAARRRITLAADARRRITLADAARPGGKQGTRRRGQSAAAARARRGPPRPPGGVGRGLAVPVSQRSNVVSINELYPLRIAWEARNQVLAVIKTLYKMRGRYSGAFITTFAVEIEKDHWLNAGEVDEALSVLNSYLANNNSADMTLEYMLIDVAELCRIMLTTLFSPTSASEPLREQGIWNVHRNNWVALQRNARLALSYLALDGCPIRLLDEKVDRAELMLKPGEVLPPKHADRTEGSISAKAWTHKLDHVITNVPTTNVYIKDWPILTYKGVHFEVYEKQMKGSPLNYLLSDHRLIYVECDTSGKANKEAAEAKKRADEAVEVNNTWWEWKPLSSSSSHIYAHLRF